MRNVNEKNDSWQENTDRSRAANDVSIRQQNVSESDIIHNVSC